MQGSSGRALWPLPENARATTTTTAKAASPRFSGFGSRSGSARDARRVARCASAPPLVASELVVNDKTFTTPTPPQAMAVSRHLVWLSYADGGCEVRNARTAEVVKRFAGNSPAAAGKAGSGGAEASGVGNSLVQLSTLAAGPKPGGKDSSTSIVIKAMLSLVTRSGEPQVWLGLSNGTIEVHHGETAELLATLKKHLGGVCALAEFGGLVYSGGQDQQVVQWRSEGCRYIRVFFGALGHEGEIRCMHAEGNALVTGAADETVKVWDVGTGDMQLTGYFHARAGGVSALCRVGQMMWSGDDSGQLVRWLLRTAEAVDIAIPHRGRVTTLKRAGSRVYSGSADGSIGVLCAESGRLLKRIEDQARGWLTCIACPAELSRFVVWSADSCGRVRCWYQDEHTFLSRDHEQLNEEAWYRSGSTPYAEFRQSIALRNAQLRDQLSLAETRDARTMAILRRCSTVLGGGGAVDVEAQYARLQDQMRMVEDRRSRVVQDLQKQKDDAAQVERDLATTMALLQSTQSNLNALSAGYGDRLVATLPPVPSTTTTTTTTTTTAAPVATPGVTTTGIPGTAVADTASTAPAPPATTGVLGVPAAVPGPTAPAPPGVTAAAATATLPTNPMLPPQPLTQVTSTGAIGLGVPGAGVAPLQPLGVQSPAPAPTATTAAATLGVPAIPPLTTPPVPPVPGIATAVPTATGPADPNVGGTGGGVATSAIGVGGQLGQPEATTTATVAPAASPPQQQQQQQEELSHEQQVLALLASVGAGKDNATKDGVGEGVKWVNPNVGNYIQRRYYGAYPSLRTPALEKRERRQGRMPKVKVIPLTRSGSAAAATTTKESATETK